MSPSRPTAALRSVISKVRLVRAFVIARWLRRFKFKSRDDLERFQRHRIERHLAYLRLHSRWFADALAAVPWGDTSESIDAEPTPEKPSGEPPTDTGRTHHPHRTQPPLLAMRRTPPPDLHLAETLASLPLMDKQTMMANFDALNTVGVRLEDVTRMATDAERSREFEGMLGGISVGLSSGTSGHRGVFIASAAERDEWAGTVLAHTLPRGRLRGHRIALFLRANNELYETVGSRAVDFRFYDIYGDLAAHARDLERYAPTILVAPPSVLDALLAEGVRVRPHRVYSVAEALTDSDAARFAEAFGQDVIHQLYQCTEGFLARTCERGVLHLNEEIALFEREPIDERRFVPIVTDFTRRSQPIVRYRLGDILVLRAEPCPCGSVLTALERIEGREDDTLIVGGVRVFADMIARALIMADGFEQYRVVQTGPDRLCVHLDRPEAADAVRASLGALWERIGVVGPELEFVPFVADTRRKLRRVVRAWRGEADAIV